MRCLIIDDEPLAHKVIRNHAEGVPYLDIAGSAHSALGAMSFLEEKKIELIFLDINMPKIQGLDFLKTLSNPPLVIVITAYPEFALEGYELKVIDYLLKPIALERFLKAVGRAHEQIKLLKGQNNEKPKAFIPENDLPESIFVKDSKAMHQVTVEKIHYLESYGSYVKIHVGDETLITLERLANYESKLSPYGFIRIHKSYLVPRKMIKRIEGNELWVGEKVLPIGAVYRHNVIDLLG